MKQFVLTGLFLCLLVPATAQTTRSFSATYDVEATALLNLKNVNGQLTIRTANVNTITVDAVSYFRDEIDEQFLDDIEYVARNTTDKLTFFAKFNTWDFPRDCEEGSNKARFNPDARQNWWWDDWSWEPENCYPRGPITNYTITVPAAASLRLTIDQGELDIDAPTGTLRVSADEGFGIIRNITNDVDFRADDGNFDLEFANMANVYAESEDGRIGFTFANAGDFSLDIVAEEDANLLFTGRAISVTWDDDEQIVEYAEGSETYELEMESSEGTLDLVFN